MPPTSRKPRRNLQRIGIYLLSWIALGVVYHLAARVGLKMAYVQVNTSPFWPPTGIALATLLRFGSYLWPGITLGVLLGSLFSGANLALAFGMACGNTLEAGLMVYGLRRFVAFRASMDRLQDVIGLLAFSLVGTTVSATIGSLTLMATGFARWEGIATIWLTWWIGNLLGALVITPLLLVWSTPSPVGMSWRRYLEGAVVWGLLALVTWYVFSNLPPTGTFHQGLIYTIFPFVIWAALRLGQRGAATANLVISGIAIWETMHGLGPFALESMNDSLILLQTFMAVVSLTSLILAAAIIERRKAEEAFRLRVEDLAILNDASETFLENSDQPSIFQDVCRLAATRLGFPVAWIELDAGDGRADSLAAVYGAPAEAVVAQSAPSGWPAALPGSPQVQAIHLLPGRSPQDCAAFPLSIGGKKIGWLRLLADEQAPLGTERRMLIHSFTNLAAVAIQINLLLAEVQNSNRQLHALSQRLIKAQEAERLHLSRELHDESGQLLAALRVQLGLLERDADQPEAARRRIAELKQTTDQIKDNLHQLAVNLRPASLDHLGLVTALRQYVEEFSRQYNIRAEMEAVGRQTRRLPIEVETALFRVVQESLTNVALHAQASSVDVLINLGDQRAVAIIEDDGVGFSPASGTVNDQLGLFGMRERIGMLGGNFTVESSPGRGTAVRVEVPYGD
ncbi:MAG TPA: MASE1 domain-containing protein [Anaerolineales bacterium]|nr:MASE1 domain-containing protein [Anaerolineales bacterium]